MEKNSMDKVMSFKEAVGKLVRDGDELVTANWNVSTAMALVSEIIRQKKKHLMLYSQSGDIAFEYLVGAGCVDKIVSTILWVYAGTGSTIRRLQEKTIEYDEYTNFQFGARFQAGMYGYSFIQVPEGPIESDLFKKRTFLGEDKYKVIKCPYTGKDVLTVPAANPDVCIVHVQRADKFGNAQYWGAMGSVQACALASKKIIVSCEEIVDHDVIRSSPHHTIIPAFRTSAVVEAPYGALPSQVVGYYYADGHYYGLAGFMNKTDEGMKKWLDEWIHKCEDHKSFLKKYVEIFGKKRLESIRLKPYFSEPVSYGVAQKSQWDETDTHYSMGIKYADIEKLMKEEGLYHE